MGLINRISSDTEYRDRIISILPRGPIWAAAVGSQLYKMCWALAGEAMLVHNRIMDLLDEADPRTADETLDAWERNLDLPDPCLASGYPTSDAGRQQQITAAQTAVGGQTPQYFIDLAAQFGEVITIGEPGDYVWTIDASGFDTTITLARASDTSNDRARAGDRVATWDSNFIECLFQKHKPAHTILTFTYDPSQYL